MSNIKKAVSNLLSYKAKIREAPCSSEVHFATALTLLVEMSGYSTNNQEFQEIIDYYQSIRAQQ